MEGIQLDRDGAVGTIALARPPVNALDAAMLEALSAAVMAPSSWCPGARALLLRAEGPHFSAGHDRAEVGARHDPVFLDAAVRWLGALHGAPLPIVAAVHGAAIGTGAIVALSADLVVADASARLALPEVALGMLGGAGHAMRWLPTAWARRLVLTGEAVTGAELASVGAVLPPEEGSDALATAQRLAAVLAAQPPAQLAEARAVLRSLEPDVVAVHRTELRRSAALGPLTSTPGVAGL